MVEQVEEIVVEQEDVTMTGDTNVNTEPKEIVFDELDDDIKRFIDRERTKASKTARENAFKDPQLRETIKSQLAKEAQMTAEEKLRVKEEEILRKTSELSAREYLMKEGNLFGEDLENALNFVVSTDTDATLVKSQKYVETLQKMVDNATTRKVDELIKKQPKPKTNQTVNKAFKDMTYNERMTLKQTDPKRFAQEQEKISSRL